MEYIWAVTCSEWESPILFKTPERALEFIKGELKELDEGGSFEDTENKLEDLLNYLENSYNSDIDHLYFYVFGIYAERLRVNE